MNTSEIVDYRTMVETAARAADSKGATDLLALEVGGHFALADAFLLVTGSVERNVQAISDEIEDELNAIGVRTIRREGRVSGRWILLDFGDIIVHVFHHEERDFYQLERLWQDCPEIDLSATLAVAADLRKPAEGDVN